MRVRLVCWNLHGVPIGTPRRAERMEAVARRVRQIRPWPDVVLFQEVFLPSDLDILRRHLGARYQLVDDVPRREYPPWFLPFLNLAGIFLRFRKSGLAAFVSRRWEIVGSHFEEFRTQDWELKLWEGDGYADKGFHRLDLRHRRKGERLSLFNTHTQAVRRQYEIRGAQIQEIAAAVSAVDAAIPVLIAGDFNVRPREALYRVMTGELRWNDLTRGMVSCGDSLGYREMRGEKCRRRRDYVFARPDTPVDFSADAKLICNFADDVPYSDHHGIDADIRIRQTPARDDARAEAGGVSLALLSAAALRGPSTRRTWLLALAAALSSRVAELMEPARPHRRRAGADRER
jgi:endonuclease/exonuclease/phosphatase family metal-dependent hydrolase